jgi:predicted dehydrogenase
MKKIRWGIISTGRIAESFAQDMAHVDNGELIAVAARSEQSAKTFSERHQIPRAYGDYRALMLDPDIDAVYIATPHNFHIENTSQALKAGKAVLCEKPLTTTPDECKQLMEVAKHNNSYLMEAMWTYFLPAICKAQEWIQQGRIGRIRHVKADFGYPLPFDPTRREYDIQLAGGSLLEMGIYPVAIATLFFQRPPDQIKVSSNMAPNGVDDDVVMVFDYPNGIATLATSFRCKLQNWAYIIGEDGYIAIPDFWRANECFLYQLDEQIDHFCDQRKSIGLNFQAQSVGQDLFKKKHQSERVPLSTSLLIQEQMAEVKNRFSHNGYATA